MIGRLWQGGELIAEVAGPATWQVNGGHQAGSVTLSVQPTADGGGDVWLVLIEGTLGGGRQRLVAHVTGDGRVMLADAEERLCARTCSRS